MYIHAPMNICIYTKKKYIYICNLIRSVDEKGEENIDWDAGKKGGGGGTQNRCCR